jgi:hypothetical protein
MSRAQLSTAAVVATMLLSGSTETHPGMITPGANGDDWHP